MVAVSGVPEITGDWLVDELLELPEEVLDELLDEELVAVEVEGELSLPPQAARTLVNNAVTSHCASIFLKAGMVTNMVGSLVWLNSEEA